MMRSLSSGVAGLRAHQTKMDVIGTNIANVNTFGFKTSRVSFSDVYYQTLSSGSRPSGVAGGTNPTQIGYGSMTATIDVMNTQSGLTSTDRALDIYINGDGMVATKDAAGNLFYSRLGITGFDAEGNLVDGNGQFIMGFPMTTDAAGNQIPDINPDGTIDIESLSRITVDPELLDRMTNISIGTTGEIVGTLGGDPVTKLSKKAPPWLVDIQIDPEANIIGEVKVTMEYRSTFDETQMPDWIDSLAVEPNSGVDGAYEFSYDRNARRLTAINPETGEVLTGTYRNRGSTVVMTNAAGKTVMTIATNALNEPANGTNIDSMDFTERQMLRVDWTDEGGTANFAEMEYNGTTVGDITLPDSGITLTIDPALADKTSLATLESIPSPWDYTPGPPEAGFIVGAPLLDPDSPYDDDLYIAVGTSYTPSPRNTSNRNINFMINEDNREAYDAMCAKLAAVLPEEARNTITIEGAMEGGSYVYKLMAECPPGHADDTDNDGKLELARATVSDLNNSRIEFVKAPVPNEYSNQIVYNPTTDGGTDLPWLFDVDYTDIPGTVTEPAIPIGNRNRLEEILQAAGMPGNYTLRVTANGAPDDDFTVDLLEPDGTTVAYTDPDVAAGGTISFDTGGSSNVNLGVLTPDLIARDRKFTVDPTNSSVIPAGVGDALKASGINGTFTLEMTPDASTPPNFTVSLIDGNGVSWPATGAAAPADGDFTFNVGGVDVTIPLTQDMVDEATNGPPDTLTLGVVDDADARPAVGTYQPPNINEIDFANVGKRDMLQLYDGQNRLLAEFTYNDQTNIQLGDLSLVVNPEQLRAIFAGPERDVTAITSREQIGELTREEDIPVWEFEGVAANSEPGEGESYVIGVMALAKIPNMVAMEQFGSSYFTTTANSGEPVFVRPGINGTGTLKSGYLEMSNVDVSKEFTEMITTQRGFQANTRIITVSDEMLNELVNLKR